jgi:aerobic C4-dicarboxylate transport protein
VVPTGYLFNLDGTNISLFIAQALHVDLSWGQLLTILLVAMLTSKGRAASPAPASSLSLEPSPPPTRGSCRGLRSFLESTSL